MITRARPLNRLVLGRERPRPLAISDPTKPLELLLVQPGARTPVAPKRNIEAFIPKYLEKFQLFILSSIVYYAEPARAVDPDDYSTVTDFARFLGWSTSVPLSTAT
jgi:hypothetical protein